TVHHQRIARCKRHALRLGNVFEFPAMHWLVQGDIGFAAIFRHIEEHAACDEAGAPVFDTTKGDAVEGNLLGRIAAVPHALIIPCVAQCIEVGGRDAMVINTDVVGREATGATRHGLHPVLCWISVTWTGKFRKVTAQGYAAPGAHQRRSLDTLLWRDEVY